MSSSARRFAILLGVVLLVSCSSDDEDVPTLRECPPAPFGSWSIGRCEMTASCRYATPNGLLISSPDGCNDFGCSCGNGEFLCTRTARGCSAPSVVRCASSVVAGASCAEPDNRECERVEGDKRYVCACDKPGPLWRCVAIP